MAFLKNFVRSLNQITGSVGPRMMVNQKIARYGNMTELTIDAKQNLITATLQLKGEKDPIQLRLSRYHLQSDGVADTFTVEEVYVSREWMQALASDFLQNKPLAVPPAAAKWLRMIL
jgi:hypothetical protein